MKPTLALLTALLPLSLALGSLSVQAAVKPSAAPVPVKIPPPELLKNATDSLHAVPFQREPLTVPESAKFTVSRDDYPGLHNPNPHGWYYKCANVVLARDGALVASWQLSDKHTSTTSWIMVARSADGGRTWTNHRPIAHANVNDHGAIWVVPQMSVLRDGRIVIVCDRGQLNPGQSFPMLSDWQKPDRGMSNWVFWSADHGQTWTPGEKIDEVGGEPGYVVEMADGTLAFTRTSSKQTDQLRNPPKPWNDIYYRNEIVLSDDGGKTWGRNAWLADSPFHGDCEVGLAELAPGKLIAATRIGLGNGRFGHPSRLIYSDDNGRTWPRAHPAPFYGQRVHLGKLQSGKLLATYRNLWGTPGSRALVFDPAEQLGFQPASHITDESRCELTAEALTLRTGDGARGAVEFNLYPAQDDMARIEFEATLKVDEAEPNGVAISAGCWVRFEPARISLAARPAAGFAFDTRGWHTYRLVRERGEIAIFADGVERLREKIEGIWVREVRFGNRQEPRPGESHPNNRAVSHWRALRVKVANDPRDYSIDWRWTPKEGYPDQFRRDRTVILDHAHPPSDCGYSSWTQLPDGRIVILDYTNLQRPGQAAGGEHPRNLIRAYLVTEADL
ncbi:MAG: sialidase family protein, partial [Verrucomicrobiota bacterium]